MKIEISSGQKFVSDRTVLYGMWFLAARKIKFINALTPGRFGNNVRYVIFSLRFCECCAITVKFPSGECHISSPMASQVGLNNWQLIKSRHTLPTKGGYITWHAIMLWKDAVLSPWWNNVRLTMHTLDSNCIAPGKSHRSIQTTRCFLFKYSVDNGMHEVL